MKDQLTQYLDAIPTDEAARLHLHAQVASLPRERLRLTLDAVIGLVVLGPIVSAAYGGILYAAYLFLVPFAPFAIMISVIAVTAFWMLLFGLRDATRRVDELIQEHREDRKVARWIAERRIEIEEALARPALTASAEEIQDYLTPDEFLDVVDIFSKQSKAKGENGHARSNWLKSDGAKSAQVIQLPDRDVEITRPLYEKILRAMEIRGRGKGRSGRPTLPN